MQSVSAAQVVLQAVPDAQIREPGHGDDAVVEQVPLPLQVGVPETDAFAQVGDPQLTPEEAKRQPPAPSQVPSWPQVVLSTAHFPFDEPRALIGRQRPFATLVSAMPQE